MSRPAMVPAVVPQRYEAFVEFSRLTPHPANPNQGDVGLISELLQANGFAGAILAQESTGIIIDGEHRREAAIAEGMSGGPVLWLDIDDDGRDRLLASLNESTRRGMNDEAALVRLLTGLAGTGRSLAGTGYSGDDLDDLITRLNADYPPDPENPDDPDGGGPAARPQSLADRFLVPPFSVLDARQGYWQARKRAWLALGLHSEEGRPRNLLKFSDTVLEAQRPNRSAPGDLGPESMKEIRHRDGDRQGETRRRDRPNQSVPNDQSPGTIDEWRRRDGDRREQTRRAARTEGRPNGNTDQGNYSTPRDTLKRGSVPASHSGNDPQYYYKKRLAEREAGRELTTEEFEADWYEGPDAYTNGTSVFDPVLCELAYRWWCPPAGAVLDPFAGGSVRGIVAGRLGLDYIGVDLRPEQVAANQEQAEVIGPGDRGRPPVWVTGDSRDITPAWPAEGQEFDLVFSCPPYYDLEQYSDDPDDLSNAADYDRFTADYRQIIARACARLAPDRFAVFVVGEIRDSRGLYRGLVGDTIAAFEAAGLTFYNEAILVTSVGSLALRAARIFSGGRKLGKSHQNVLVFCKGDWRRAAEACGVLDIPDPAELFGTVGFAQGEPAPGEDATGTAAEEPRSNAASDEGAKREPPAGTAGHSVEEHAPAWAKGYPLAALRQVKELWAAHDEGLVLGAFMGVKENQVADWAGRGQLATWARDGRLAAAAVTAEGAGRAIDDFRGQAIARPQRGDTVVTRFAGDPVILAAELAPMLPRLWMHVWMENPADRWLAAELGLTWCGTKIRASSELIGVYGPEAAARPEGLDLEGLARLDLEYDPGALLAEVQAAEPGWTDHYASYNQGHTWQAVALRGYGGQAGFIQKPAEMSRKWKADHPAELKWPIRDTPLYASVPGIRALMDSIPGRKHRVRLMRLAPGNGELTRHSDITDPDAGTGRGQLMRLHFPLATNPLVIFRSWTLTGGVQTAHMGEGEAWYLDTRKPHTARNDGGSERIHVVADVEASPRLAGLANRPAPVEDFTGPYRPGPGGEWEPWPLA
jgi:hypothetical protein